MTPLNDLVQTSCVLADTPARLAKVRALAGHLGELDPATGDYMTLGKTFNGLTDAMLAWQTKELLAREIGRDGYAVRVRRELVAEIAISDVQASPRCPGDFVLRLARVKRYRDDKRPDDAYTIESVRRIYRTRR